MDPTLQELREAADRIVEACRQAKDAADPEDEPRTG
jgi:hypothetical protein